MRHLRSILPRRRHVRPALVDGNGARADPEFPPAQGMVVLGVIPSVGQQLDDAPVVGLEELPQDDDIEQLPLGEVPAGEAAGGTRKTAPADLQGLFGEARATSSSNDAGVCLSCYAIMPGPLPDFQDLFNGAN